MPEFLYVVGGFPPRITEINITDSFNPFVQEYYQTNSKRNQYVGLPYISVTKNIIVCTILDINTQRQFLRIYSKKQTRNSIAKWQYLLPEGSISNFYKFPNPYVNTLLYRDEQMINITQFYEQFLIVNASSGEKNHQPPTPLNIQINVVDQYRAKCSENVTVIYVTNQNTSVFAVSTKEED